jgi:hypothetical protein
VNRIAGRRRRRRITTRRNISIRRRYRGDTFTGFIGAEAGLSLQTCF